MIARLLAWLRGLFRKPVRRQRRPRREKAHHGAHYYLGDLLDQLDDYYSVIRALKKADPQAYRLFHRLGAQVSSMDMEFSAGHLEPYILERLPSFACCHVNHDDKSREEADNWWIAAFISAQKQTRPVNVQLSNKTTYEVTVVYRRGDKHYGAQSFFCDVDPDGSIHVLRQQIPKQHRVGRDVFVRMEWRYPDWLMNIKGDGGELDGIDINGRAAFFLSLCLNVYYLGSEGGGITVRVRKGRETAKFSIDLLRSPYFFADRDKVVNHNGRTKRIMHIVRAHRRANGTYVKSHFRGLNKFTWNGYNVTIGMTGKHLRAVSEFGIGGIDERDAVTGEEYIPTEGVGDLIDQHYELEKR